MARPRTVLTPLDVYGSPLVIHSSDFAVVQVMVTLFAKNDRLAPSCQHNLFEHRLALEILQSVNMVDFVACAICTATELALFSHEPTFKRTTCFNRLRYGVRYFILCDFCSFAVLILGKVHPLWTLLGFIWDAPTTSTIFVMLSHFCGRGLMLGSQCH